MLELDHKESWAQRNWYFWNVILEKTLESPSDCQEIKSVSPKGNQSWIFKEGLILKLKVLLNTLAMWCKEPTHYKRPWCWEKLKAGEEGDNRGWDGWMASPTQWTWVWLSSRRWWRTGKPGVIQSMGHQRVGHDWVTELNWESCDVCTKKPFTCKGILMMFTNVKGMQEKHWQFLLYT